MKRKITTAIAILTTLAAGVAVPATASAAVHHKKPAHHKIVKHHKKHHKKKHHKKQSVKPPKPTPKPVAPQSLSESQAYSAVMGWFAAEGTSPPPGVPSGTVMDGISPPGTPAEGNYGYEADCSDPGQVSSTGWICGWGGGVANAADYYNGTATATLESNGQIDVVVVATSCSTGEIDGPSC